MNDATPRPRPRTATPRVLLVDPDDRVRESLVGLIGIGRRVSVVGSAGHAEAALALVEAERPDVVLVDPRLPELDGGRFFIARLRRLHPEIRIVVMGWADALEDGQLLRDADACVRKTFRPNELVGALLAATDRAIDAVPDAAIDAVPDAAGGPLPTS